MSGAVTTRARDLFEKCKGDEMLARVREAREQGYYPYFNPIERNEGAEAIVKGRRVVMVGSNNYLGLTMHPHVVQSALDAVRKYGSGCTGSRLLNGTLDLHETLEARLAKFVGKPAAQVFSTGFMTNLGTISTLVGKGDVIYCDRENHASILDGTRLSFGTTRKFRHADVADFARLVEHDLSTGKAGGGLLITDGVFSMGGDLAPLPDLCREAQRLGVRVMVDDAHGIGVMGPGGRGTVAHFGVDDQVDLIMGTFSKSFASLGGFIAGDTEVIAYIKHHARALVFAASPTPASTAAVLAVLDVMEREPERLQRLWANVRRMQAGLRELGFETGKSESAVVPVIIGDEMKTVLLWKRLFDEGVYANPVIAPASPSGKALIRTSYTAAHEPRHLDRVLEVFAKLGKEFGLI